MYIKDGKGATKGISENDKTCNMSPFTL